MIKLKFQPINHLVTGINEYDDFGGLPVNLILNHRSKYSEFNTYYLSGNNFFIEFRFSASSGLLCQIAFVSLGTLANEQKNNILIKENDSLLFECFLDANEEVEEETECDIRGVKVEEDVFIHCQACNETKVFSIADNVTFTVDGDGFLCSIIVHGAKDLIQAN
ncbi:MAG TPA: hypothetical protein VJ953_18365 [Saprospiraceae bacterium]|nr:hypothetical protein [Saprospiraceae bacterium]